MGKESQARLWVQRRRGFNFLSFQKLQKTVPEPEPTVVPDPCVTPPKQSGDFDTSANDEAVESEHDESPCNSMKVEGITDEQGEGLDQPADALNAPATRAVALSSAPAE
ncbi:unnamed protein product [Linum trigynum]|uniref:Uncharacterized protein n=1 Tax=Linum trigynum TaxID=586398 RepID=A0AAV2FBK1_9ROSI